MADESAAARTGEGGGIPWTDVARQFEHVGRFCRLVVQRNPGLVLSGAEVDVLTQLALDERPLTPGDVSKRTGISKEALSRLVRGLLGHGFVERVANPSDGRSALLSLTPAGRLELEKTYQSALRPMYALIDGLGEEDYAALMALIERADDVLEGQAGRPRP